MAIPKRSSIRDLDVIVAGLSVVDLIGLPVNADALRNDGGLREVDSITMTTGGIVPNVGINLSQLGLRVGVVSRVGNDSLGGFVRSRLEVKGISTEGLVFDRKLQTSATIVHVSEEGERSFLHARGCTKNFRADDVLEQIDVVRRGRFFVFGYLGLMRECEKDLGRMLRLVKQRAGVPIALDTAGNPERDDELLRSILPSVDLFIPSRSEAAALTGQSDPAAMVDHFRACGAEGIVGIKLGADGVFISSGKKRRRIRTHRLRKVVDATGAGDAFFSGMIAGLLAGKDPWIAAAIGNRVAASCLTAVGASTAVGPLAQYLK
jgi:sugar/nucleoside kinase (ribokinase family)